MTTKFYMSEETVRDIIGKILNFKFDKDVNTYEKIEDALKVNLNVYTKKTNKPVYITKNRYSLTIEFNIISAQHSTGELKEQHLKLERSMNNECDDEEEEEISEDDQKVEMIKKELGIYNSHIINIAGVIKKLLHDTFKYFKLDPIDEINEYEKWLKPYGMKAKLYAEKEKEIEDYYDIDVNGMYGYILSSVDEFRFPTVGGREIEVYSIDEIDKKKLGFYKLKILSEVDERRFMKNPSNEYTNYDMICMDEYNYKYELLDNTAYIYDKSVCGKKFFGYMKDLYEIRKTSKNGDIYKKIMAQTGGMCAKKNIIKVYLKKNIEEMTDEEIDAKINKRIKKLGKGNYIFRKVDHTENIIELVKEGAPHFSYGGLARIHYFLTSYGRLHIARLLNMGDIKNSLVYVHTDGWRCKTDPIDLIDYMGKDLGELKCIKLCGKFKIVHLNCMKYYDEIKKEWINYKKDEYKKYLIELGKLYN